MRKTITNKAMWAGRAAGAYGEFVDTSGRVRTTNEAIRVAGTGWAL